jgi:CRP-like cAMP-binding protein
METLERILAEHPFLQGLDRCYLQMMVGCAINTRFNAGDFLFREGDEANKFYLLREGKVRLELNTAGRASIAIQTLAAGEVVGWSWLIPPYRWRFDARAVEPTRAFAMDGVCLRQKCEEDHDLGYVLQKRICQMVTQRLQSTRRVLLEIYDAYCDVIEGRA